MSKGWGPYRNSFYFSTSPNGCRFQCTRKGALVAEKINGRKAKVLWPDPNIPDVKHGDIINMGASEIITVLHPLDPIFETDGFKNAVNQ